MKDLTAATGIPKATIQYYIKEGLIPKPVKTHANMAYYSEEHINAIRLVRELQSKRYLPLSVIKKIVKHDKGALSVDELQTIAKMDGKLFKNLKENLPIKQITAKQLAEWTGTETKEIRELERMGILHPQKKGKQLYYGEDDIRFMECWKKMRELGFSKELGFGPEVLAPHRELLERLVDEETKIMMDRTLGKITIDDMVHMVEEGSAVLNTMIGIIHKQLMRETVKNYAAAYTVFVDGKK
jgi:DNA-binding transcriptional MerR regulator